MNPRLGEFLAAHLARYEVLSHEEAFTAQEEAARTHVSGWRWAKVVVLKKPDGYLLAVLPASAMIDLGRLKGLTGEPRLELASVEEMGRACTGFPPGAVPPFGRLFGMATWTDAGLLDQPTLTMPGGDPHTALRMSAREFVRLATPQVGAFAMPVHLAAAAGQ